MKRKCCLLSVLMLISSLMGCSNSGKNDTVIIYSAAEDYRNEFILSRLNEQFPNYNIKLEYLPAGNLAAKIQAEGKDIECDIVYDVEYGYAGKLTDNFETLTYDETKYIASLVPADKKYLPDYINSACIALNKAMLDEKGLSAPASYSDLLKPEYKNLISMPNPKSSGTGYIFLKSLVNIMGEDEAFDYFDKLSENILQFTTSGAGPINALTQGEVAIALGMTSTAVKAYTDGYDLEIVFFEEGAPYSSLAMAVIDGRLSKEPVKKVFEFFEQTLNAEDNEKFVPEQIYNDIIFEVENYPKDIKYADMSGSTPEEKERLLNKWEH